MPFVQVLLMFWGLIVWVCPCAWAEQSADPRWDSPLLQQVSMPAAVQSGIYYPAHDEWVYLTSGAWKIGAVKEKELPILFSKVQEKVPDKMPLITLKGRIKLSSAVKEIAALKKLGWVLEAGVEDKEVTADLEDMPPDEALCQILSLSGYGFKVVQQQIHVLARDTRTWALFLPPVVQKFLSSTNNESSSAASFKDASLDVSPRERLKVGARVQVENSSQGLSFWQDVETNIKGILSPQGVVSFNRNAGLVLVTDTPVVLDKVAILVDALNRRAAIQITVDVKVVEVTLSKEYQMGIDWSALASAGSLKPLNFATNFSSENFNGNSMAIFSSSIPKGASGDTDNGVKVVLKALESFGRVDMLSQPKLSMLNNAIANIQVGETKSYVESTNMETTSSGAILSTATLNEVHGGITLQILGSMVEGDVYFNVTPVVSTIDKIRTVNLGGGNKLEAPETSVKAMSTQVRVALGQTVAIGGLISRETLRQSYGVPLLSKIPLFGRVFTFEKRRNERKELIIFMTPLKG